MTIEVRISKNHWRRLGFYAHEDGITCPVYCQTLGIVPTAYERHYMALGYLYATYHEKLPDEWMDN